MDWVIRELDDFEKRDGDAFYISEENKQVLREIYPYWKGRTLQDKGYASFPEQARLIYDNGVIRNEGNITSGDAHLAVDYEGVLQNGLVSFRLRAQKKLEELDYSDYESLKSSYFYRAVVLVIDAVETYAKRYAQLAERQAAQVPEGRREELLEIARYLPKGSHESGRYLSRSVAKPLVCAFDPAD